MPVNLLGFVVGVALLLSIILLIGLCLSCRRQPSSIREEERDYMDGPNNFIVQRQYTQNDGRNTLSPQPIPSPQSRLSFREGSIMHSDDESSQDYVNEVDENEDDDGSNSARNYIVVIPESVSVTQSKQSRCSSQTSQGSKEDYQNIIMDDGATDDYQNIEVARGSRPSSLLTDSDNEESGEYVNAPPQKAAGHMLTDLI